MASKGEGRAPKAIVFECEMKGINTGKTLGKDTGTTVTAKVTLECNVMGVSLDALKRLQRSGALKATLEVAQLDWNDGASTNGEEAGEDAEA